ncbi:hypothetical protein L218DRAFT_962580 [Marasmius fiardii PR-910]|nr:hypothetical protein L218DRAFT_962580 [Marasmius fiardii PR-910]
MATNSSGNKRKTPEEGSSPRKSKNIYGSHHQNLPTARSELAQHYKYIPEKSMKEFFAEYLPPISKNVVDEIMEELKNHKNGGLTPTGKVWGYATTPPGKIKKHESVAFKQLCAFLQLIIEYAGKEERRQGRPLIAHGSKQTRLPGERANSSRPDSHLHLLKTAVAEVIIGWEQLLAVGEFKKALKNQNDNWAKVLWGMNHIMRNDPCRLFTFGYSVEDNQARLWYHARSCVVVSEKFDWVSQPHHFVKFVLALSLTDSKYFPEAAPDAQERTQLDLQTSTIMPSSTIPTNQSDHEEPWENTFEGSLSPCTSDAADQTKAAPDVEEGLGLSTPPNVPDDPPSAPSMSTSAHIDNNHDEIEALYRDNPQYLQRIGIDPTMQRFVEEGKIQYRIRVKGAVKTSGETGVEKEQVFVTDKVLCDWKADCGTGRATRVWIVYREGDLHKERFVLKDVWLEDDAEVEGDKLDKLEEDVQALEPKLQQWFKDHFLHKYMDQKVGRRVPGVTNSSSYIYLPDNKSAIPIRPNSIRSGSQRAVPRGGPTEIPTVNTVKKTPEIDCPGRFHYRIVFKDEMTPLEAVSNRLEASEVVIGILRACWVLWKCKRVHRDVSSWNALWDSNTKTGRLADYDYMTEYGKTGTGTVKTGTPHFWSIEVEKMRYLYLPQRKRPSQGGEAAARRPPDFYHNFLHDLESVYWVSLWTMLWLVGDEDKDDGKVNEERQLLAERMFSTASSSEFDRGDFIRDEFYREPAFAGLEDGIRSSALREMVSKYHINDIPLILFNHFTDSQVNFPVSGAILSHDDDTFKNAFLEIEESLESLYKEHIAKKFEELVVEPIYTFRVTLDEEDEPQKLEKPLFYPNQSEDDESDNESDELGDAAGPPGPKRPKLDGASRPSVEDGTGSFV